MSKRSIIVLAALLSAAALALAACSGSSSSSAASGSTSASSATSASAAAAASSAASASASAASSAAASDVSPELKEAGDKMVKLAEEQEALVKKAASEGGYDAVRAEWDEISKQISEVTSALKPWGDKYAGGSLSDADKSYYMRVVVPAASRSASAGLDMLDYIKR